MIISGIEKRMIAASSTLNKSDLGFTKKIFYFKNITKINKKAFFIFLLLFAIGVLNLFTVSRGHAVRQMLYFTAFLPVFILLITINPRYFIRFAYIGLGFSILLLLLVFVIGDVSMGARRWIDLKFFKFQPSEFAKITTAFCIARYYHFVKETEISKLKSALFPFFCTFIQAILILKEPDLGTTVTLIAISVCIIFLAGLKIRYFVIGFFVSISLIPIIWNNLHDYQKGRVKTFLNPEVDLLGAGYNIQQAKIAIGSGGAFGKGFFGGTQGALDFLPESHTDFAFTIFAEQFGFFGCFFLLLLYAYLIYFGFSVAVQSESHFIRLAAGGISCIFFLHIIINLLMTSGLIPVVGNPLPLISYGGTFLLSNLTSFAILLNFDTNKLLVIHSSSDSYMEK